MSETELPGGQQSNNQVGANHSRRKRVVAREVEAAEAEEAEATVAQESLLPATIPSGGDVDFVLHVPESHPPHPPPDPTPVVDPTILGYRQRRHGHHRVYRWTQLLTMFSALASAAGVICTMVDEPFVGRILAGSGLSLAVLALFLSTRTSLSSRWRGWAVAAVVFAVAALTLTWIHGMVTEREGETAPPPAKKTAV
jgi:hypothetical protein